MKRVVLFVLATLMPAMLVGAVSGQVSQATEAAAEEMIHLMLHEGGSAVASELIELGGETAVRALLQRAAREGGGGLVDRVVQYGSCYGPPALKAIEPSPSRMIRALDRLPPDLIQPAIRAAARDPELTSRLVSASGDGALEVMARLPGVGSALVEKLGEDGLRMSNHLTTDQAVALARHAEDVASLPSAQRNQLLDAMAKAPAQVLDFLESHPKALLTAGGVSAFIAAKENILGRANQSSVNEPSPSLIERVIIRLIDKIAVPVSAVIALITIGIGIFVLIRLRRVSKSNATCRNRGLGCDARNQQPLKTRCRGWH